MLDLSNKIKEKKIKKPDIQKNDWLINYINTITVLQTVAQQLI